MSTNEKEFISLIQKLTPEDLKNVKIILQRFEDPKCREIRERFIAETEVGTLHRDSLAEYAQAFRSA